MSLALLLEKYDVSTEEGLEKALNDIEKEEVEVNEALSTALSRACTLEGRLRTASQAYTKLGEMKADAQGASNMVEKTAELARDVSAKVRQLDLARSRVAECQRRVHDLIDLQLCSAGVEAAIKAHDYETGAMHVSRFLSMDPGSVAAARARGAPDPRQGMAAARDTLQEHLVRKFKEAARAEDTQTLSRLARLFPQIGAAEDGVDLLAQHLAKQAEAETRRGAVVSGGDAMSYADALTRVLEAGAAASQRAASASFAPGLFARALKHIQPVICASARGIASGLRAAGGRGRGRMSGGGSATETADAHAADGAAAASATAQNRLQLYFTFLRRRAQADAASLDEPAKKAAIAAVEKIIAECDLTRTAQDLLSHYLEAEREFLEECFEKALKMATPQPGMTSSNFVDDVFFIARKVIRRSISTGSIDGVCAALNEAGGLLERAAAHLRRTLRTAPPDPLATHADRVDQDLHAQRMLFLANMSSAESGAEWAERLAQEALEEANGLITDETGQQKLAGCAAGLAGGAAAFRAAAELGAAAVLAALAPRLAEWAEVVAAPDGPAECMEDDADIVPSALEQLCVCARAQLPAAAADGLLAAVLHSLAHRAEGRMLTHTYDWEGGARVERRARRVCAWAGGGAPGARERAARLKQAAAVLGLSAVGHVHDVLKPTARLPPGVVKDLLARRSDFKMEDIKRLKL